MNGRKHPGRWVIRSQVVPTAPRAKYEGVFPLPRLKSTPHRSRSTMQQSTETSEEGRKKKSKREHEHMREEAPRELHETDAYQSRGEGFGWGGRGLRGS